MPRSLSRPMKVLLKDAKTGSYVARGMAWVENVDGAVEFGTLEAAGRQARECGGEDVMVVMRYEDPLCELALDPMHCH